MKPPSRRSSCLAGLLLLSLLAPIPAPAAETTADPLAAELALWLERVRTHPATNEIWLEVKAGGLELLSRAERDLSQGRRLAALERLARGRAQLQAALYVVEREARGDRTLPQLEREWARLEAELKAPPLAAVMELRPAALRALAEASVPQAREYYQASLDYGHNTEPASGFFFLGTALAQRELPSLLARLATPTTLPPVVPRAIDVELQALEGELLAAYRPPASIDRHSEFIVASATLKEAREANAAGLYYGALLIYLRAVERLALLKGGAPPAAEELASRLAELESRLEQAGTDHTVGQLFLEFAGSDLGAAAGQPPTRAAAILREVIPRYLAALGPAPAAPPRLSPQTRVTLVRWPYT